MTCTACSSVGNRRSSQCTRSKPCATALAVMTLLLVAFTGHALAQTPSLSVGTASGTPGAAVNLSVNFSPGSTSVSSLQFDLGFPSSLTYGSTATGAAATAAGKSASGNAIAGGARVLVFGFNQTAIGAGTVATVQLNIAAGTTPGTITVSISGITASDPSGTKVTASGSNGSVTVTDTTAPTITNVAATGITSSGATITWTTNEPADSQVDYGKTASYGSSTTLNATRVTSHSQALSGLSAGTLYHYRVKSRDAGNNLATSGDYTFTTTAASDTTQPTVAVTSPTSSGSYTTTSSPLSIGGSASDNVAVTQVAWSNSRGGNGVASGTTSWSVTGIALLSGSNVITVTARDAAGNMGTAVLTVTFNPSDTTAPTVSITSPTSSGSYSAASTPLSIGGTASDNVGVTLVSWTNTRGGSGIASGTTSWSASGIALQSGSNVITVSASDAVGNSGTAVLTVTFNPSDTTAPTVAITSPTSSGSYTAGQSPLSIGGTASDNIGVTQVTWASDKGGTGTASGTTSWVATGIALVKGSNIITVTASDAVGNAGTANLTVTYTPSDTTPPTISGVSVRVTATTAVISWTTDKPTDSQVEYGSTSSYGSITPLDASLVTSHSVTLTALKPETTYHFRVMSKDSEGNLAVSSDFTFKTNASDTNVKLVLYYPSISSVPLQKSAARSTDEYTSIALTNLDGGMATLKFTAYDATGALLVGDGIVNPVIRELNPGEQMPVIDIQLFGNAIMAANPLGWIEVESSTVKLAGFFMGFDSQLSLLDGSEIASTLLNSFVLPEIADQDFTKILVSNPNPQDASMRFYLITAEGSLKATSDKTIRANATLTADLLDEIFPGVNVAASDHVRVSSTKGLLAYETLGKTSKDIAILAGQDTRGSATQLYSPQYVVGGPWRTTLSIVNLEGVAGTLTLKLISDSGVQIGPTIFRNIAAGGKLYVSDQTFFTDSVVSNPDQVVQGYVEVTGLGLRLTGSVVFGDAKQGIFSSALPLVSDLKQSVIFSHVASDERYFTGLAILNPNDNNATATIDLYGSDGALQASATQLIPVHQRRSRLLTEYFPALVGQSRTSGYFKVTVDRGVACFALFGTRDLSVLSAIPAQPAP